MSDLSASAVAAADPAGMMADVLAQPGQLGDALWRVESAAVPRRDQVGGLCVFGMGGSAVGADLALAVLAGRAQRPIQVVRGYAPPSWATAGTLALCASYSGDTEETLACYDDAGRLGMPRVALTTGGELAERARTDGVPVIGVPSGMQPRAAVIYMTVCALECASLCGAAPSVRDEIESAAGLLERLAVEWGPEGESASPGKELARRLHGTIPVIFGAGATTAPATRWKCQLNENAKLPAFAAALPEADHNEICGWGRSGELGPLGAVFLDDATLHPRLRQRIALTAEVLAGEGSVVERIAARGETALERTLSLVLLGDLVSVYMAVLRGVDPMPVSAIERFKGRLAGALSL